MRLAAFVAAIVVAGICVLIIINPGLAPWAIGGTLAGAALRLAWLYRRDALAGEVHRPPRWLGIVQAHRRAMEVLLFLAVLSFIGIVVLSAPLLVILPTVRADYRMAADLEGTHWAIEERYRFGEEARAETLRLLGQVHAAPSASDTPEAVAEYLALQFGQSWEPSVDTGDPVLVRTRIVPANSSDLAARSDVIDVSSLHGAAFSVVPSSESEAVMTAPRFAIIRTSPPDRSRDPLAAAGREEVVVPISGHEDAIRVELTSGWLRNEVLFPVASLSLGSFTSWVVAAVLGAISLALGGGVWRLIKRLLGRADKPSGKRRRMRAKQTT